MMMLSIYLWHSEGLTERNVAALAMSIELRLLPDTDRLIAFKSSLDRPPTQSLSLNSSSFCSEYNSDSPSVIFSKKLLA